MAPRTRREFIGTAVAAACGLPTAVTRSAEPLLDIPLTADAAGRLRVPVYVNGHGPYRFLLDTGASHCAVTRDLARRLALPPSSTPAISVNGTLGRATAEAVDVASLEVGTLRIEKLSAPVIDASEGILGANALAGQRLRVDNASARISLSGNPDERDDELTVVPLQQRFGGLLLATGRAGSVRCRFIIDTGAQRTIGNAALARRLKAPPASVADPLVVTTPDGAIVARVTLPALAIRFGAAAPVTLNVACADLPAFALWQLTEQPAVLLGMDYLSRLERFVIDYRRSTFALRTR